MESMKNISKMVDFNFLKQGTADLLLLRSELDDLLLLRSELDRLCSDSFANHSIFLI